MKKLLVFAVLLSMVFGITAFQCSSTEMTSAKLYIQQKKYDKAQEMLEKEIEKNPKSDEAYYWLGFLHGENEEIKEMVEAYNKSLEISDKFAKDINNNKKYFWSKKFNSGVALFNKATKAETEKKKDEYYDESITAFNQAIMCEPDSVGTYKNLAFAYMNAGQMEEAIPTWKRIIELEKTPESYASLGEIYLQKAYDAGDNKSEAEKYFEKAIEVLEEGREEFPQDNIILRDLSNAYVGANKVDVAIEAFKEGVLQEPDNKYYRYNYGSLLLNVGEFEEAAKQLEKAIELDPQYENAIYNLGVTYVKWGAQMREDAEAAESDSKEFMEKYKAASPLLEKYLEMKPEDPAVWELLGKIYANLGETEKSTEAFNKADEYRQ